MSMTAETRLKRLGEHALAALSVLFALSILAAAVWTIYSRSFDTIYRYGGRIALPIFVLFLLLGVIAYSIKNEESETRWWHKPTNWIGIVGFATIGSLIAGFMYYSAGVALKDSYEWATALTLSRDQRFAVLALIALTAGSVLFLLRHFFRSLYGLTEVIVGVFVATLKIAEKAPVTSDPAGEISTVLSILNTDAYVAVLTAGVYLVVRGLDNMHQGIAKDPRDLVVGRLVDWLRASPVPPSSP